MLENSLTCVSWCHRFGEMTRRELSKVETIRICLKASAQCNFRGFCLQNNVTKLKEIILAPTITTFQQLQCRFTTFQYLTMRQESFVKVMFFFSAKIPIYAGLLTNFVLDCRVKSWRQWHSCIKWVHLISPTSLSPQSQVFITKVSVINDVETCR